MHCYCCLITRRVLTVCIIFSKLLDIFVSVESNFKCLTLMDLSARMCASRYNRMARGRMEIRQARSTYFVLFFITKRRNTYIQRDENENEK